MWEGIETLKALLLLLKHPAATNHTKEGERSNIIASASPRAVVMGGAIKDDRARRAVVRLCPLCIL